eukprot:2626484-Pleurochrysis_carterae.AAC.1
MQNRVARTDLARGEHAEHFHLLRRFGRVAHDAPLVIHLKGKTYARKKRAISRKTRDIAESRRKANAKRTARRSRNKTQREK